MTDESGREEGAQEEPQWHGRQKVHLDQDTVVHLMRAGNEFLMAMDTLMPRNVMPPETKEHYRNIKKETLLLFRSLIDGHLKDMEERKEAPAPRVRKINLD